MADTPRNTLLLTILALLAPLLTITAGFSHAAPFPSKTVAERVASGVVSTDGFRQTVEYWGELERVAGEVQNTVITLANQATEAFPSNNTRSLAYINAKLADKYPGAKYDGKTGTVPLPNHLVAAFGQDLKVTKIMELFPSERERCSKIYYIHERKFECNSGSNTITGLINRLNPGDSLFTEVKFAAFQDAVDKLFPGGPETKNANVPVGVAVLNDAYQLSASTQGMRMDSFAEKFLLTDDMFKFVLKNAQTGYKQRHASEFSAKESTTSGVTAGQPGAPAAEGKFLGVGSFFIGLFLVVLALLAALFYGFRWFFLQLRNNINVENRVKYGSKSGSQNKKKNPKNLKKKQIKIYSIIKL